MTNVGRCVRDVSIAFRTTSAMRDNVTNLNQREIFGVPTDQLVSQAPPALREMAFGCVLGARHAYSCNDVSRKQALGHAYVVSDFAHLVAPMHAHWQAAIGAITLWALPDRA